MSIYPSRLILHGPAVVSGTDWHRIGNRRIDGSAIAPCVAPGIPPRRPEPVVAPVRGAALRDRGRSGDHEVRAWPGQAAQRDAGEQRSCGLIARRVAAALSARFGQGG
ncbi:hypothetical protein [Burkholderia cepacia]|uniref:hypothetical protein n=1 Tax=Burkholderia cepacia TaxID=292 RepID=UPI0015895B68|nr:hypothetical protein [Burkholderia cepacia]